MSGEVPFGPNSSVTHVRAWQLLCDMQAARHQADEPVVLPKVTLRFEDIGFPVGGMLPESYMQLPLPADEKAATASRLFRSVMSSLLSDEPTDPVSHLVNYAQAQLERFQPTELAQPDGSFAADKILPVREILDAIYGELFNPATRKPRRREMSPTMKLFILSHAVSE